jgi:hypothetical protein
MKCSICKKEIIPDVVGWNKGHNAQPINNGRCCTDCNNSVVLTARIKEMFAHQLNPNL